MMLQNENIYQLVIDDLSQSISAEDKQTLLLWLESDVDNKKEYEKIKSIWFADLASEDNIAAWKKFLNKTQQSNNEVKKLWIRAAIVASLILFFASGWLVNVFSSQELTLTTNNESFLKDTLEDGSQIFLYPSSSFVWNKSNNHVQLNGSAYFIIPPTNGKNYTINLGVAQIEVKGTAFKVNTTDKNENISVRVESGSVELFTQQNKSDKVLVRAGEEGFYSNKTKALWKDLKKENIYLIYKPNL